MLLREGATDPALVRRADKIKVAAERCARIVKNFLALARHHPPERGAVDLNRVVHEAAELLAYELRTSGVEVQLRLAEALPTLHADGHQLHQVLVNLIANAHQAMRQAPAPRRITITTIHDADVQRVRLTIADTGPGIPADVRAKIFEPFFTTKPPGEGTGLGLSLCRGIAEEHGGTLAVDSEPGRGAEFVLELPATVPAGTAVQTAEPPARVSPKAILVVDDEPEIAATLAEALERDGHKVDIAGDGAEGLDRLGAGAYDVIFTDTRMPGLYGVAFYQELARRFPALTQRVIFLTGDLMDQNKREFLEGTGCPVISKPFDLDEVRRALHRLLTTAS
jgi:two-component system NtrC family sensor kinase